MKKRVFFLMLVGILVLGALSGCKKSNILHIQVMADTEVSEAMEELMELYQAQHKNVRMNAEYDDSKSLFERVKDQGEECNVFLTNSQGDMDILDVKRLMIDGTRKNLLTVRHGDVQIVYLVAKVENRDTDIEQSEAVSDFIEYLSSEEATAVFEKHGFEKYVE